MSQPKQFNIVNGPSKWGLMLALFDSTATRPRVIAFETEYGHKFAILVSSIEREDGSGESWNIQGHSGATNVKIYFSTKRRTGTVTVM